MITNTKTSPALKAALGRAAQFLHAPVEQPGQRAFHHLQLASLIEKAVGHAILAGEDDLAFKLSALRGDADAAFRDDVTAAELAYLNAEIDECATLLAVPIKQERGRSR